MVSDGYDYIVVGAGSSGAVVAGRLSEDPAARVLLLEAGPDFRSAQTPAHFRPMDYRSAQALELGPEYWWPELTMRRTRAQEPRFYRRGRGVGGSSTVNGMLAIRGVPEDFDNWASFGAAGWSFADVLPAHRRLEDDLDFPDAGYHGRGGPVPVYRPPRPQWSSIDEALAEAALDLGFEWAPDHNAPAATGVSPYAMNARAGLRVSTNDGYLEPARARANLEIRGNRHVDVVLFEQGGRRASGVRTVDGDLFQLAEGGEVIVSAGTVHSPAILQRSGLGPESLLRRLGVHQLAELPVGLGVQGHPGIPSSFALAASARPAFGGRHSCCCLRFSSGIADAGPNDLMAISVTLPGEGPPRGAVSVWVNRVYSRGVIAIRSTDALIDPEVDVNMLDDERDVVRLSYGLERVSEITGHRAFDAIAAGPRQTVAAEHWLDVAEETLHLSSGCRMGAAEDAATVVDPDCRVLGFDNLRIVDCSIMPEVVRANTHLTAVAIGEHASARIAAATH